MPDWTKRSPEELLQDAGCSKKVIAHCRAVRDCACEYAARCPEADYSLVETGAWLHDIGRSIDHSIRHAQAGADLLRSWGAPEPVVRIVECHLGAGLTAEECVELGLDARDCMPRTVEEKIVTHADNLIAGSTRVTIEESLASASHLPAEIRERMSRLSQEVEQLCNSRK
jgi:uncharacterized protein